MFNFDYITKKELTEHNPNWPKIPDHPYQKLEVLDLESETHYLIY